MKRNEKKELKDATTEVSVLGNENTATEKISQDGEEDTNYM